MWVGCLELLEVLLQVLPATQQRIRKVLVSVQA